MFRFRTSHYCPPGSNSVIEIFEEISSEEEDEQQSSVSETTMERSSGPSNVVGLSATPWIRKGLYRRTYPISVMYEKTELCDYFTLRVPSTASRSFQAAQRNGVDKAAAMFLNGLYEYVSRLPFIASCPFTSIVSIDVGIENIGIAIFGLKDVITLQDLRLESLNIGGASLKPNIVVERVKSLLNNLTVPENSVFLVEEQPRRMSKDGYIPVNVQMVEICLCSELYGKCLTVPSRNSWSSRSMAMIAENTKKTSKVKKNLSVFMAKRLLQDRKLFDISDNVNVQLSVLLAGKFDDVADALIQGLSVIFDL